ncbi:MAG: lipopolysaccharide transport periplasmic protein LptA [Alteromonadaceae bacterium]|nr:lipopolysaccharide transport periplasmic protein LptA [Alteromonadaceae bacterium]
MNILFLKKQSANLLLLATTIFLMMPSSFAAKIDLDQEVKITAKSQTSDLKSKVLSYIENVQISQGSVIIKADLAQVYTQDNNKVYLLKGKPATFEQILEDGSQVRLEANEIKYEPSIYMVTITGSARFISPVSDVRASKITYNTLTETQEAASNNNEIVTTILKTGNIKNQKGKTIIHDYCQ